MADPLLKLENLTIGFDTPEGHLRAVDGVDFDVAAGEALGVVGESGCGKSVTALGILGLLPSPPGRVDGGKVLLEGDDLLGMEPERLRRIRGNRISMIFQEPMSALNPLLTIGRQLTEGLMAHGKMSKSAAIQEALDWLDRVRVPGGEKRLKDYPHQLSGGMRQRIMIAMALVCRPLLLIADEPTTALDVTIQAQILSLMRELKESLEMALLLITHDLAIIAQTVTRVVVMYAGQVVEVAATTPLFEAPFHPYTQGLLTAIPVFHRKTEGAARRLPEIPGAVPILTRPIAGCRFIQRCPHAFDPCRETTPPLREVAPGHLARCWLNSNGG